MADRTGADRPTPTPLHIRIICRQDEIDIALGRLRQAFSEVRAGEPRPLNSSLGKVRLYVKAAL